MSASVQSIRAPGRFGLRRNAIAPKLAAGVGSSAAPDTRSSGAADAAARWCELQPPGSFPLCVDAQFDGYVAGELMKVVEAATRAAAPIRPVGLILTGSLARGEGALIREHDGRTRWLSDIECIVVLSNRGEACGALGEALTRVAAALVADSASHAAGLKIQLSPISSSRLARMPRGIFGCELVAHGKLVWGRPLAIAMAPSRTGELRTRWADAFRLLNNRIIEHVALRAGVEDGTAPPARTSYRLSKFWIELGTSLSVFLDCYRTTYRERHLAIAAVLGDPQVPLEAEVAADLRRRLDAAMRVRRGEIDASQSPAAADFAQAARLAQRVWEWESARMLARPNAPLDDDWRAIPRRMRRVAMLEQCGRDWARWYLHPDVSRRMGPGAILPALRSGCPGNAIYAAGCLLEFYWDEVGARHEGAGTEIAAMLGRMFSVGGGWRGLPNRRQLVGRAVAAWHSHLRDAAP